MMRTKFNKRIVPQSESDVSFFSDEPDRGTAVPGFFNAFLENSDSAVKLATFLGGDLIETAIYNNPSAGNGMGHRGTFVRFQTKNLTIDEVTAFVATLD